MALGGFVLGSLIIYLKGMRRRMFQLSGFYYNTPRGAGVLQKPSEVLSALKCLIVPGRLVTWQPDTEREAPV